MRFLSAMGDLIIANLLFLICALPVITIGPALSAVSKVMYELSEHTCDNVPKTFFAAFKANFKAALIAWFVAIVCFALLAVHLFLITSIKPGSLQTILLCIWVFVLLFLTAILSYLFPLISRYENTLFQHLRNAMLLSVGRFPRTLLMILLNIFPIILFVLVPAVFFYLIPFWVLIGFACVFRLDMLVLKPLFKKLDQLSHTS